ncbi:secreted RxLR effector protein 161-like [Rosa chinensis]|uniref:secreted RxLR effector protein 161-like n=1 Tax=Rosa chinensis TaxID=74649 RepID=UPI001AD8FF5F|nr:secreted RxLR effector protein 161-like [Rosa chinensis]
MLARFPSNPGHKHWVAGKKILRYLQRTKNHMLVYRKVESVDVVGYTDSDFAGHYPESMKSTSGYVYVMAGGAIAWKSVKQTPIATSTMQEDFIAIYEGSGRLRTGQGSFFPSGGQFGTFSTSSDDSAADYGLLGLGASRCAAVDARI